MSQNSDEFDGPEDGAEDQPRVRFTGIVEADGKDAARAKDGGAYGISLITHNEKRWNSMSRQVWQVSRLTAIFVFFSAVVGLPLGNWFAHQKLLKLYGTSTAWDPFAAYGFETLLLAIIIPMLVLLAGYLLSKALTMVSAAESIAAAAQQMTTPDIAAARNADSVGAVVQSHVSVLNEGLDGALSRLATVEAMIRQHVEAIEIAGEVIEQKATGAVSRVADERARLMELTESLNAHADSFAAAIAEKAKTSIEALQSADSVSERAESEFDDRLTRLEGAAARALTSFESLRDALRDTDESLRASAESIDASAAQTLKATERASAASNAASESAARNAANVAASANRAAQSAKQVAGDAIETATEEAERIAQAAIDVAAHETSKIQDATAQALEEISQSTKQAIGAAVDDAATATKAAEDVSEAARKTSEAAAKASADVTAASERARKSAQDALKFTEQEAGGIEQRNAALAKARAALEKENERLETLIEEQRKRADRLADAIASQTERLSRLAEAQLREQEAAARLAQAQNEMQKRADQQVVERKRAATQETERNAKAEPKPATTVKEATKKPQAQPQAALDLESADRAKKARSENANGAERLEELARDIAERRPRRKKQHRKEPPLSLSKSKEDGRRRKSDVSWREILDAAEDAEPLELGAVAKKPPADLRDEQENAIKIISRLQIFTHDLEIRLYGNPPPALQERFDRGDRNVFANRLLRLNEADVKRRIRTESGRDKDFETGVHGFLQGFEKLLEEATTSETADEELEEYLSSPLGRVYLLIGATVGYFA